MYLNSPLNSRKIEIFPVQLRHVSALIACLYGVFLIPVFLLSHDFLKLNLVELEKFSDNPIAWLLYFVFIIVVGGLVVLGSIGFASGLIFYFIGFGIGILFELFVYPIYLLLKFIFQIKTGRCQISFEELKQKQAFTAHINQIELVILFIGFMLGILIYFLTRIRITHLAIKIFSQIEYSSKIEKAVYLPIDLVFLPLLFSILTCFVVFWIPFLFKNRKNFLLFAD